MTQPYRNGLTRIQIDCGAGSGGCGGGANNTGSFFSGLPINPAKTAGAMVRSIKQNNEQSADTERESLLDSSSENKTSVILLDWNTRCVLWLCAITCTAFILIIIVLTALVYTRLNNTIYEVDSSVSIANTARSTLSNVNTILQSTAALSQSVHHMATKILNTTQEGLADIHRLVEHPTITIGR